MAESVFQTALSRYQSLEKRDRLALNALSTFFGLLFLVYGIWVPANDFHEARRADRDRQLNLVQYMRASEKEARAMSKSTTKGSAAGQTLLTQVSRTAQTYGIPPNRLQPEGSDGVSVWFDGVAFNELAQWMQAQANDGIMVRQISIDRHDEPGKVNARIVLRN